jgi:UDP-glucose 4-epimerase
MNLDEAVDLVLFAFEHATQGDLFVQKSPASTVYDLAVALKEMFDSDSPINVIGTRHGEKLDETLLTREERANCIDMGSYFRVPADTRDLNYEMYFAQGDHAVEDTVEYSSSNTERLDVEQTKELLKQVQYVQDELLGIGGVAI